MTYVKVSRRNKMRNSMVLSTRINKRASADPRRFSTQDSEPNPLKKVIRHIFQEGTPETKHSRHFILCFESIMLFEIITSSTQTRFCRTMLVRFSSNPFCAELSAESNSFFTLLL